MPHNQAQGGPSIFPTKCFIKDNINSNKAGLSSLWTCDFLASINI